MKVIDLTTMSFLYFVVFILSSNCKRFISKVKEFGGKSMRKSLKGLAFIIAALTMLLLAACGGGSEESDSKESKESKELVVYDWGGSITDAHKEAIFDPFEEEYGVKVIVETPVDYGKFKTSIESGTPAWDVANIDDNQVIKMGEEGLLEPLDYDIISADYIDEALVREYGLAAELYSVAIAYNPEKFEDGDYPQNWQDFWDTEKYPGARALWKYPMETLEIALLADGVPGDELYPLDVDRAFASLDKLKENADIIWWDTGAEPPELLATGSAIFSSAWNAAITSARDEGVPVDLTYNQALMASESWVVPKNATNRELAMKFIEFATSAEQQAKFSSINDYTAVNQKGIEMLPDEIKQRLGQTPEMAETQVLINQEWWAENLDEVTQRFQEWLLQ